MDPKQLKIRACNGKTLDNMKRVVAMARIRPMETSFAREVHFMRGVVENRTQFTFRYLAGKKKLDHGHYVKAPCSIAPFSKMDFAAHGNSAASPDAGGEFTLAASLDGTNNVFNVTLTFKGADNPKASIWETGITDSLKGIVARKSKNTYEADKSTDSLTKCHFRFEMIACPGKLSTFVIDQVPFAPATTPASRLDLILDAPEILEGEKKSVADLHIPLEPSLGNEMFRVQCVVQNRSQFTFGLDKVEFTTSGVIEKKDRSKISKTTGQFIRGAAPVAAYSVMEFVAEFGPSNFIQLSNHSDPQKTFTIQLGFGILESGMPVAGVGRVTAGRENTPRVDPDPYHSEKGNEVTSSEFTSTTGQLKSQLKVTAVPGLMMMFIIEQIIV
ncbi:hypothetical protein NOR_08428 [Metarhizium rileyi]|uniref:Uncharacterized protein n=1 Tax=Metarhizium rileyi (strain RCEF 4871) TaxID=1649241 RepID=A0A166W9G9_METRR|nr:hypothetical protein NOR_08428 [Metarhizium rileyi RCEF 4871]